jgi:aminoglycoside phosphotransferase (APT) family kinase protein
MWEWSAGDLSRLSAFLAERGVCGPDLIVRLLGDGHSNLTYLVDDGDRRCVVRRPPPPPTPPGAHDVLREARVLTALKDTPVPTPHILAVAEAGEVLDVPLYAMTFAEGPIVTITTPPPLDTPEARSQVAMHMVEVLADLHAVDWQLVGGRPDGFNRRHLSSLARLVPDSPSPAFTRLRDLLLETAPAESGASVIHNDFRIGNLVLAPDPPGRVLAVLDWELATTGDPLFDLGYFLACVPDEAAKGDPGNLTATQALSTAMNEPGFPTRSELAERYATRTGRDLSGLGWYVGLAHWKLAVLYEYQRRKANDPYYADPTMVTRFVRAGLAACSAEEG